MISDFARRKGSKDKKKRKRRSNYGNALLVGGGTLATSQILRGAKKVTEKTAKYLDDKAYSAGAASLKTGIDSGLTANEAKKRAGNIYDNLKNRSKKQAILGKAIGGLRKKVLISGGLLAAGLAGKTMYDRHKEKKEKRRWFSLGEVTEFARIKGAKDKKKRKKPTLEGHVRKGAGVGSKIGGTLGALHGGAKGALAGTLAAPGVGTVAGGLGGAALGGGLGYLGGAATGAGYGAGVYGLKKNRIEKLKKRSRKGKKS